MFHKNVLNFFKHTSSKQIHTNINIIKSRFPKVQIPNISVHEYIWKNLDKWPDKTALVCIDTNRSYTFHELYKTSLAVTNFLRNALKLQTQDTAAIVLPNIPEFPIAVIGSLQAGLRITTCNPSYTSHEIQTQLRDSEAKVVFTCHQLVPTIKKSLENNKRSVKIVSINHQNNAKPNNIIDFAEIISKKPCTPISANVDDVALLPYSIGISGLPKGVQLTHRSVVSNLCQTSLKEICPLLETTSEHQDVTPAFLPFHHIYGLALILIRGLSLGVKTVSIPKLSSESFIKMLKEYRPTAIMGVPSTVLMINNNSNIKSKDLSNIRTLVSGAAHLGSSDIQRFNDKTGGKIKLLQLYGMTETSTLTLHQSPCLDNGIRAGGCGILIPNTEARVIPVDGPMDQNLGPNERGELLFRGPQVMKGYFQNPEADKAAFVEDGWIRTGDVGYYDEDEHFYMTDTLKDIIKVKGFQVAPAELEEILRKHPKVKDVAIIGIPHSILGEAPKAYIVLKSKDSVEESELKEFLAKRVAQYKHLAGGVDFIDNIPRNPSGKILRKELRKLHKNNL